jgi:hypothetical protein
MIVPEPAPQDEVRGRRHRPGLVEREHREPTCGVPQVVRTILGQQSRPDRDPPRLVPGQQVRRLRGHVLTIPRNADVVLRTPTPEAECLEDERGAGLIERLGVLEMWMELDAE